jgi:hypothetical protein
MKQTTDNLIPKNTLELLVMLKSIKKETLEVERRLYNELKPLVKKLLNDDKIESAKSIIEKIPQNRTKTKLSLIITNHLNNMNS